MILRFQGSGLLKSRFSRTTFLPEGLGGPSPRPSRTPPASLTHGSFLHRPSQARGVSQAPSPHPPSRLRLKRTCYDTGSSQVTQDYLPISRSLTLSPLPSPPCRGRGHGRRCRGPGRGCLWGRYSHQRIYSDQNKSTPVIQKGLYASSPRDAPRHRSCF